MEFRILGLLAVAEEDRPVAVGRGKESALLAVLLVNANRPLSVDELIDELWETRPPANAAKTVQIYVSRLRRRLGHERIVTTPAGYLLRVEPGELDASRFEQLAAEGQSQLEAGNPERAEIVLSEALDLWRGEALADFRFARFAQAEIRRLQELHGSAVADRVESRLALGRAEELITELEALIRRQPLWERPRRQLMLALYHAGRQADALELYQATRALLAEELGLDPSPELQALERAILNQASEIERPPRPRTPHRREDAVEPSEPSRGAFVGRGAELEELLNGLGDAFDGRGSLFLLAGEPGIGKSRLADELIREARVRGARILAGRCWEAGGAPAYWPWVQSLRAYVREAVPELLRAELGAGAVELAQILPELHALLPELPEPASPDSEGARFRLFDATAEFLQNASARRPIVLILDDLHAADTPSLLLLQFVARCLSSARLLVVGAFRDVDPLPGQPLTTMLAEVVREPTTRRIALGGLSEADVAEYVELTASEIASPELVAALHEETEGNPLFVSEALRLLALEGLRREPSGVRIAIPQSVHDVIARRLTHLSDECNRVLVLASVLGREFDLTALARVGGLSEDELLERLDEAMAARVVSDVPGAAGRLRFAHVLIRDTLYEALTTARRVRLHRLAAETLESLYGDETGPHLAELAHHSIAGNDFAKGALNACRAGGYALALLAYEEAARLYEKGLAALDRVSAPEEEIRAELLLSLGEAELCAGESLAAKRAFLEAAEVARRLGVPLALARAATGYGGRIMYARAGDDDRLVPLLEEALAMLADGDVELRVGLLARLAGALRDEPDRSRRDALSREAVELARRSGNPIALGYALDGRAAAIMALDTVAECLALGNELREIGERIGDVERIVQGLSHRIIVHVLVGEIREAEDDLAAMSRIAEDLRQPVRLWQVYATQAMLALGAGRFVQADDLVTKAFVLGERAQPEMATPVHRLQRYALCDFRGGLEEVELTIRELVTQFPARPVFRCALAHLLAQLGRTAQAKQALDDLARADFSTLPFDMEWLYGISLLAETSALLSDRVSASTLYGLLLPWAALNVADHPEGFRGSASRYLGLLAATTEHWNEAAQHFQDALVMNERMGARPWLAHTQHDYAQMLLACDGLGNRERARELLDQALETYHELEMEPHVVKASGAIATW